MMYNETEKKEERRKKKEEREMYFRINVHAAELLRLTRSWKTLIVTIFSYMDGIYEFIKSSIIRKRPSCKECCSVSVVRVSN